MATEQPISYTRHRYLPDIIGHCVWLYFRFSLSFRDVEVLMAQRDVEVFYESIRTLCETFGRQYARKIRRQRGSMGDTSVAWRLPRATRSCDGQAGFL